MTKDAAAEKILKKHWDSLPRHMESYTMSWEQMKKYPDTINALLAAMEEYGASLQPKEADKDREIERLKAMQQKFEDELPMAEDWNQELLLRGRIKSLRTVIGLLQGDKQLTDKDIQSKWISVEAVKELLAKQRVLCAEYLEDSFSEHPYKLHQMINYAPEPPLPNRDQNVQECDARKAPSMGEPLANNSPKEEDVEKMALTLIFLTITKS
jgi:hypothetical protein